MDAVFLVLVVCGAVGALVAAVITAVLPRPSHPLTADEARSRRELRISGRFDRDAALELRRRRSSTRRCVGTWSTRAGSGTAR